MSFDIPKVVRSPGCDHRHDKEYRKGRDIKIDILEGYVDRGSQLTPNQSRRHHSPKGNRWCVDDELLALVLQI